MIQNIKKRFINGILFTLLVAWFFFDAVISKGRLAGSLLAAMSASIFDGDGLEGGLEKAQSELSGSGIRIDDTDFYSTIAAVLNYVLPFVGLIALIAFIVSGFMFILGFGSDATIQRAQKIMIWSAVGLLVIIFAYPVILFIISFTTTP